MAEYEFITKTLPIDANLQAECQKLEAEGWKVMPGTTPVAIYNLHREKPAVKPSGPMEGLLKLSIDDSKVHIIRGSDTKN